MASWEGISRGKVIGYKIFGWSLKYLGLDFAYFLLLFVSAYFVFASGKAYRSVFYYFHSRLGYSKAKSVISIFRNYYRFGQVIIDKTVILGGFRHKLILNLEGKEYLRQMNDGGIIISGHIGNWEVGGQVLDFLEKKINIVVFDAEKQAIKNYMSEVLTQRNVNVIAIRDDFSHLFEIKNALENKEIIALHGDRFIQGNKTVMIPFLGKPASFPLGPWHMAAYFKKPVSYVFAIKETRRTYRFFATPVKMVEGATNNMNQEEMLISSIKEYVSELEKMVRTYPLQWYNYFDFWKEQ
jgi:predicted LPLAT superfamily acyltransferase